MDKLTNTVIHTLTYFMKLSTNSVFDKFHNLPNAFADDYGDNSGQRFVYIPGARKDRVLLVAHADTVWGDAEIKPEYKNDIIYSGNLEKSTNIKTKFSVAHKDGTGIGADDRAGCAILWAFRKMGHSLLITDGEEIGCKGSKWLAANDWWKDEVNKNHQFALQFDRKGNHDIAFYAIGTNKFVDFIVKSTQYEAVKGRNTDVAEMCQTMCGCNMSTGYYDEHTPEERLVVSQFVNTLATAQMLLTQSDLPRFDLDSTDIYRPPIATYTTNASHYVAYVPPVKSTPVTKTYPVSPATKRSYQQETIVGADDIIDFARRDGSVVKCHKCNAISSFQEFYFNNFLCPNCNTKL